MAHSHHDDLRLCHVLADNADAISMEKFRAADLVVTTKPDTTWVTEADQAVERTIRRTLRSARTRDTVLGEESGEQVGTVEDAPRRWIIDPIDGTSNYVRGVPVWATLIALAVEDEVVASCVSAPALGRRWWASKGGGAYTGKSLMSATRLQVSKIDRIDDASLAYASLGGWEDIGKLESFLALTRRCWRTRGYGDFWSYMLLAEGAVDIAAEPELALWDMAALDPIVREAGGTFTALNGQPGPWHGNALATNTLLHDAAMAYLGYFPDPVPHDEPGDSDEHEGAQRATAPTNVTNLAARRRSDS
ncbi:histidinol phosphatase [Mumia sp. zg.B53]|uniref:inositol monophosphatase family protein n=1 Tax=unclassified Mumia TaxID=2621872 RepID=UPI001C6E95F4|nr:MULTISPECIES: inositol monophosphatase family protein [unclassified Mumia]MBW9215641.1 histidinol phosphatase [Mumia sp. zg.B53]MDD9347871.1 histidinol phosphatase [Mumia sp.]